MNIVMVTFAFGQLLVQVLMGAWAEPYPIEVAFPIPDVRLTKCWPLDMNDDLVWPPSTDIPAADFGLIAASSYSNRCLSTKCAPEGPMMPAPTSKALFSTCLPTPGRGVCRGLRPGHEGAGQGKLKHCRAIFGSPYICVLWP